MMRHTHCPSCHTEWSRDEKRYQQCFTCLWPDNDTKRRVVTRNPSAILTLIQMSPKPMSRNELAVCLGRAGFKLNQYDITELAGLAERGVIVEDWQSKRGYAKGEYIYSAVKE